MRNLGGHRLLILAAVVLAVCPGSVAAPAVPEGLGKLETIVVLYLENRSFDHLYGHFPGANGLANAGAAAIQTDESGKPYETLPAPLDLRQKPPVPYAAITEKLPNGPFPLHKYYAAGEKIGQPHSRLLPAAGADQRRSDGPSSRWYSDAKGYAMGYWDTSAAHALGVRQALHARRQLLPCRASAAPSSTTSGLSAPARRCTRTRRRRIVATRCDRRDGQGRYVTPDGYGVNTMEPIGETVGSHLDEAACAGTESCPPSGPADPEGHRLGLVCGRRGTRPRPDGVEGTYTTIISRSRSSRGSRRAMARSSAGHLKDLHLPRRTSTAALCPPVHLLQAAAWD